MYAHRAGFVLGVLMAVQYGEVRGTGQGLPSVRVTSAEAKVFARPEIFSEVLTVTRAGAVFDLIDKREGWYWILLGRDENGSRQPGWIQASQVAIAAGATSRDSLRTVNEELGALPSTAGTWSSYSREVEREKARNADAAARGAARLDEAARIDVRKAERENAGKAAADARAVARIEKAVQSDSRKAERENARKTAADARAAARVEEAARKVEDARHKYEGLTKTPE